MGCYYDSSFLLAAILEDKDRTDLEKIWEKDPIRLSSNIMKIECIIAIRRAFAGSEKNREWALKAIEAVSVYFPYITCKKYDEEIENIIVKDIRFSSCRTLDAIHIASAFYFKPYLQEEITVCSFDKRMLKTAEQLGFKTYPVSYK